MKLLIVISVMFSLNVFAESYTCQLTNKSTICSTDINIDIDEHKINIDFNPGDSYTLTDQKPAKIIDKNDVYVISVVENSSAKLKVVELAQKSKNKWEFSLSKKTGRASFLETKHFKGNDFATKICVYKCD